MANELIFSIEQGVFIYDQHLLTQSASHLQCAKLKMCSMTVLLVGIYGLLVLPTWPHTISISGVDWKCCVQDKPKHTLEELKRNIRDEINKSIEENYSDLWKIL